MLTRTKWGFAVVEVSKMPSYAYTPYLWLILASATLVAVLGGYAWRRRARPGALPFALMALFALPYLLGEALSLTAVAVPTKVYWFSFQRLWLLPMATAALCFALACANLGRWLTRRTIALLALPPVVAAVLILANGATHLFWVGPPADRLVRPVLGPGGWILAGYGFLLALATTVVFVWLFVRSPVHRRPVALCLCGDIGVRIGFLLDVSHRNPLAPLGATAVALAFVSTMYALALFRFRLFDIVSVARRTVVQQMREGMLVLDAQRRVVDANPAAERIFGLSAGRLAGLEASRFWPFESSLEQVLGGGSHGLLELRNEGESPARYYAVAPTPLTDPRGLLFGHALLLHDATEERRAQEQLVEQQRSLAASQERDRVARELHDGLGQVLGYLKMQMQAARDLLARDRASEADRHLAQAGAVAQDAHADVREYILGARIGLSEEVGFAAALRRYVEQFSGLYGVQADLNLAPEMADSLMDPSVEVQLLRIIQEALTNVRKHGKARGARVSLGVLDGCALASVVDDGVGFDPALVNGLPEQKFGLGFMRERAESVGGTVQIDSAPGAGTRVTVSMPLRKEHS